MITNDLTVTGKPMIHRSAKTFLVIFILLAAVLSGCKEETFEIQIVIIDDVTQQSLRGIPVNLTIGTNPPRSEHTDKNGAVFFTIGADLESTRGRVTIEQTSQYEALDQNIEITKNENQVIYLRIAPRKVVDVNPFPTPTNAPQVPQPTPTTTPSPGSELETFRCAMFNYGSYYTLIQMEMQGIDLANGFDLEIFPVDLNESYTVASDDVTEKLRSGEWDCMLDTLDGPALNGNYATITAIIGESVGADQVWASSEITTVNAFAGQRIVYVPGLVSEFMLYSLLDLVGLTAADVIPVEAEDMEDAVVKFNDHQADVIIGWEPEIAAVADQGATMLLDSSDLRYLVDVISVSNQAISEKPAVVQAFHDAWFQTLRRQFENFPQAASDIASWGNNDWTGIYPNSAESDFRGWLISIAQAGYGPNRFLMENPTIIQARLNHARRIWSLAGPLNNNFDINAAIDTQFVLGLDGNEVNTSAVAVNSDFHMGNNPALPTISTDRLIPIATLPCERFEFQPDSTLLTEESKNTIEQCVIPVMQASTAYLTIIGSAAWPGPEGTFTQEDIENFARLRAIQIAQYISNQGINPNRLIIEFTLPPESHWFSTDESILASDRIAQLVIGRGQR